MSRNFAAVTPPTRPDGYDKRMTREMPREAADNSGYAERIYQCVDTHEGGYTGTPTDENLFDRVKAVRTVAQDPEHEIKDYPGESSWFIKSSLSVDDGAYIELTLANGSAIKFVANPEGTYNNSLQICHDGITWVPVALGTDYTPTGTGEYANKVWVRGRILHNGGVCPKFGGNDASITSVSGNLSSLLDYRAATPVVPGANQLSHIFDGCTALTDASGLIFPAGKPSGDGAYKCMFNGCTSLTAAPSLFNVVPRSDVFYRMFYGCTALTTAPILPRVDVLPARAYVSMFSGCTHLSSITVHIGSRNAGDGLLEWMNGAGTAVDGTCTFYHTEDTFRWIYPSMSGIPGSAQSGQKEWIANPPLTTRLFFSSETSAGTVVATAGGAYISSGDPVNVGTAMVVTASAPAGYVFDSWVKKPAGATGESNVLNFTMPYSRYDETDKIECVARFRHNENLAVTYLLDETTTHLAFARYADGDTTRGGQPMYAWTPGDVNNTTLMTGIGLIYTDTLEPTVSSKIYKQSGASEWFESTATFDAEVWTDKFTVIVFDNATTYPYSIKITVGTDTYRNMYKSFCALTAPANASLTIDVYQSDGSTHVATADLHWSDSVTDNPRTVTVLAANKGICLSRDAN